MSSEPTGADAPHAPAPNVQDSGAASGGDAQSDSYYAKPLWKRLYAFILAPAIVAALSVALFTLVSVMTEESHSPAELVEALKGGGEHRRWQAAFALTRYLQPSLRADGTREDDAAYRQKLDAVRLHVPELLDVWRDPRKGDDQVRQYLALSFGYLNDPRTVPALREALAAQDSKIALNALVATGLTEARELVPEVIAASQRDDVGLRDAAAFVLGVLGTPEATARLEHMLHDNAPSPRWNAAFGLARSGSGAGEAIIGEILDRGPLHSQSGLDPEARREQFLNAVRSAGMVRTPKLLERLRRVAQSDEILLARDMARRVLDAAGEAPGGAAGAGPGDARGAGAGQE